MNDVMKDVILVLNAGSSSIKFSIFEVGGESLLETVGGQIEGIGSAPRFVARDRTGNALADERWTRREGDDGHAYALDHLLGWLRERAGDRRLLGVGHRVVHGGPRHSSPVVIDTTVFEYLETLVPLAPLHQPHNLAGIRAIATLVPELTQVACFDTAFHRGQPPVADRFALPRELHQQGIRRYGFHGLSYEYIASVLPRRAPNVAEGRVVVAHLGNGASMCALHRLQSRDSTMGFTALDGLMMGTRCGSLDPGVLLYLLTEKKMSVAELESLLYRDSGLLGVSGISSDMRNLLDSRDPAAAEAIDLFVYRLVQGLGGLAGILGGLDALVFTAGIGEHSWQIRERVCRDSAWLGIGLDPQANAIGKGRISSADSPVEVWIIPTDEERMIAMHTHRLTQEKIC